ncbi:hypothetical protein MKW98_008309 [Papaver atlanticum]|uniref:Ubiquitin carboxyl-terminal hydrolase 7 ICP0-binding domain-containing protein n=1 Tax=Papaver atlanticum TaxID=357466 RepID=A0AAD4SA12_9MAGN|nr:hypothetical protein MKW98_008309 [Papaver atlanticum]
MAHNKDDSDLYTIIKVVRNEDLYQQIGIDVYCDLADHDKVRSFRVHNSTPFNRFKEIVAGQFGVPLQLQRFWICLKRKNKTCRPCQLLTHEEEKQPLNTRTDLILLEGLELGPDLCTFRLRHKTKEDILLFFNHYDPEKEEIRYVGNLFVKGSAMPGDILKKLNDMANFSPDEELELFVPKVICELVDQKCTFLDNEIYCIVTNFAICFLCAVLFSALHLENGDIICFHKAIIQMKCRYPDIPSFLRYRRCQASQDSKLKVIALKKELKAAEKKLSALIGCQHN